MLQHLHIECLYDILIQIQSLRTQVFKQQICERERKKLAGKKARLTC